MFDWNDEELTNIIWGEAGESDDHIVPYPESSEVYCKKKEWGQEYGISKSTEQKAPGLDSDIHVRKLDGSSRFDPGEGTSSSEFRMDSWPSFSLSNAAKTGQDALDNSVSENLTEISKFDSSGEAVQLGKDSGVFQNPNGVKGQGDFVDYSWDGSFDDLDQIFSNDDPIFGNVSLGNPDELWSSSKDITNSPVKSFVDSPSLGLEALRDTSEHFGIKAEFLQEDDQAFTLCYGKDNDPVLHSLHSAHAISDHLDFAGGERNPTVKDQRDKKIVGKDTPGTAENVAVQKTLADKVYKQNKPSKSRKKYEEKNELKLYQDIYGNWSTSGPPSGPSRNQFPPQVVQSSPSAVVGQERQLHGTEPLLYQHISNSFVPPTSYGNMANPYSSMPVLSHIQSRENQPVLSGYEVSLDKAKPVNNTADSPLKLQKMTPQEKIEKLRRRQQMQAMLAIQKQQQQFGHEVSYGDPSNSQCSQENQIHQVDGGNLDVEDLSTLPTFDPSCPSEQDDSNTTSLAVNDYSAEDTILHHLQDVVSKLDVRVRLCIRDSLFRLAKSATQRHFASDTSSTNSSGRDDVVLKEENSGRNAKIPEVETESNPIDRTVAHLLFHRPMELSGKHPDTPESPASAKLQSEHKMMGMGKFSMVSSPRSLNNGQGFSLDGSRSSCLLSDPQPLDQGKTSFCMDTSENASNTGPADEEFREVEGTRQKDELMSSIQGQPDHHKVGVTGC